MTLSQLTQREAVLQAAVDVFAERGYRGASFDAIADRVGLTRQGVLHYFPSKRALLLGVLRYRVQLSRAHIAADHADDDLPGLLAEVIAYEHEHPALAQVHAVLLAESVTGDPARGPIRDHYRALRDHTVKQLTDRYGDTLPSGANAGSAAVALLAIIDGLQQLQWLLEDDETDYPGIMREIISVVLGTPPPTSPTPPDHDPADHQPLRNPTPAGRLRQRTTHPDRPLDPGASTCHRVTETERLDLMYRQVRCVDGRLVLRRFLAGPQF